MKLLAALPLAFALSGFAADARAQSATYLYDDGSSETAFGIVCGSPVCVPADTDFVWLQYFDTNDPLFANAPADTITRIDVAFGTPPGPTAPPAGTVFDVLVYDDPNDDSDPRDLTGTDLVAMAANVSVSPDMDLFESTTIPPALVQGGFFVVCRMPAQQVTTPPSGVGEFPAALDKGLLSLGRAWLAGAAPAGSWDPNDPNGNLTAPMVELDSILQPGVWLMRAIGSGAGASFENRGVDAITFAPSSTAGMVDVVVDLVVETSPTLAAKNLDLFYSVSVNSVPVFGPTPVTATNGPITTACAALPCSTAFCTTWTIDALPVGGLCVESRAGTVGCVVPQCVCQALVRRVVTLPMLNGGDVVDVVVTADPAALPETAVCDDMLGVTFVPFPPGTSTFWSRFADGISFTPAGGPNLVNVVADWTAEVDGTVAEDLSAIVEFLVNGVIVDTVPVMALISANSNCSPTPPCDCSNCADWTINAILETGLCKDSKSGAGICVCACTVKTTSAAVMVNPGDTVSFIVREASGSLPETMVPGGNSISIGFSGLVNYCTAKTGLVCGVPAISGSGTPSATATSGFVVSAAPANACRSGILIYNDDDSPPTSFNGGTLCIRAMGLRRAGSTNSMGTPGQCDGNFAIDMNTFAQGNWSVPDCAGNPSGIAPNNPAGFLTMPGVDLYAQFWGRDSLGTGSFVSDALSWTNGP